MKNMWSKSRKPLKLVFTILWYVLAGTTANVICLVAISYLTNAPTSWLNLSSGAALSLNRGIFATMVVGDIYGIVKIINKCRGK